ncbi:MAG: hypothetical protein QF915_04520 [Candidatus Woesearchaeota archaeon]|jgi:hypothetical protein|nr:hypothetical protein [Candidatus Woesearchaeota archaeon]MDP7458138.1 hypothetical protein [Candidatus Woesearchaeota archaeon]
MKKIIALFMMLIFMLSVVGSAFADSKFEKDVTKESRVEQLKDSEITKASGETRSRKGSEPLQVSGLTAKVACESFTISNCPGFCKPVCLSSCEGEICLAVCAEVRGSCVEKDEPSKRPRPLKREVAIKSENSVTAPISILPVQSQAREFDVMLRKSFVLGDDLTVTFLEVTEDSRCPANADCSREGKAEIKINVQIDEEDKGDHLLSKRINVGGYVLGLKWLDPYPGNVEEFSEDDYVATITVKMINDGRVDPLPVRSKNRIIAHIEEVTSQTIQLEDLSEEEVIKLKELSRAKLKRVLAAENPSVALENIRPTQEVRIRPVSVEKKVAMREAFLEHREVFQLTKEEHQEKKAAFKEAREELRDCDEDCEVIGERVLEEAREFVINRGDSVVAYINKVITKIDGDEDVDPERASRIIQDLKSVVDRVETAIDNAKQATTKKELKKAADEIAFLWKKVKPVARKGTGEILFGHLRKLIVQSQNLEKKLDRVLEKIEEDGIEIDGLDAKVDQFSDYILAAEELQEQVESLLSEAKDMRTDEEPDREAINEILAKVKVLTKDAEEQLKKAHRILVSIVKEIKATQPSISLDTVADE